MATATGKFSYGICDYCGQRYSYRDLKKNWRGFMVCPEDYEPKEPQIEPLRYRGDAIALADPRPDRTEPLTVVVNNTGGDTPFETVPDSMQPAPSSIAVEGVGEIGSVTVPLPDSISFSVTGVSGTTGVGTVSVSADISYAITVPSGIGGGYYQDGVRPGVAGVDVTEGLIYIFDQSDSTNAGHPLRFSTTADGTWGGGVEYTTGVTTNGTPGNSGAYTRIEVAIGAPTLYTYCSNHSGMGYKVNTV